MNKKLTCRRTEFRRGETGIVTATGRQGRVGYGVVVVVVVVVVPTTPCDAAAAWCCSALRKPIPRAWPRPSRCSGPATLVRHPLTVPTISWTPPLVPICVQYGRHYTSVATRCRSSDCERSTSLRSAIRTL
jgi:hypothetical protein